MSLLDILVPSEPPPQLRASYERNGGTSPLLRLPAELREQICHYALGGLWITLVHQNANELRGIAKPQPSPLKIPYTHRQLNNADYDHVLNERKHLFALPATCRQLYFETRLLPYSLNIIHLPLSHDYLSFAFDSRPSSSAALARRSAVRSIMPPLLWTTDIFAAEADPYIKDFPNLKSIYMDEFAWREHGGSHAYRVECDPDDVAQELGCEVVLLDRQVVS